MAASPAPHARLNFVFAYLNRFARRAGGYVLADAASVVLAYYVALPVRLAGAPQSAYDEYAAALQMALPLILAVHLAANVLAGLYRRLWHYASAPDAIVILQAWLGAATFITLADWLMPRRPLPLSTVLLGSFLSATGFILVRYRTRLLASVGYRLWQATSAGARDGATRVLIVGAGETGQTLSWQLQNRKQGHGYQVVGFVDDDPDKVGLTAHGFPVLGGRHQIPELAAEHAIELIVLAIHAVSAEEFREFLTICQRTSAQIKIVPDVFESLAHASQQPLVRDVSVRDFLGRNATEIDLEACRSILEGRVVMVTGGAGSIGAELCRQILDFSPAQLVAVDVNETGLYELQMECKINKQGERLVARLADVAMDGEMQALCAAYKPHIVFHAAAYKHVPLMEDHPQAALRVNVLGTLLAGRAAAAAGAERFVLISSDKAVQPVSVMGATKRLAEAVVSALAAGHPGTSFSAVRFGNVLNSRGSVVPLFERQIDAGGPITVTHPATTRFFMTLVEAVRLVIQAAVLTRGGDLYMLEMGERIRIVELAERMIRLRGLRPVVDIAIEFTGLRPGEKLHEVLLSPSEQRAATVHSQIYEIVGAGFLKSLADMESWLRRQLDAASKPAGADVVAWAGQV